MKILPRHKPVSESSALAFGLQVMNFKSLALAHPGQLVTSQVVLGHLFDHLGCRHHSDRIELTSMPDGKLLAKGSWHGVKLNASNGQKGAPPPGKSHDLQTRRNDSPHKGGAALPVALDFAPEKNGFSVIGNIAQRRFGVTRTVLRQDGNPRQIAAHDGPGYIGSKAFEIEWALHQREGDLVPSGNAKGKMTRKYLGETRLDPFKVKIQVTEPEREFLGTAQTVILRAHFPRTSVFNVAEVMVCDKQPPLNKREQGS